MASIALAGRLIADPELKFLDSGNVVCSFTVADRAYVKPPKGQENAPGQFYDVEVWGAGAQMVSDRCAKGSRLAVTGAAVWREFQTKDGRTARRLTVVRPEVTYLDTKAESEALRGGSSAAMEPAQDALAF